MSMSMSSTWHMIIDGREVASESGLTYTRTHPATGETVGVFAQGDAGTVDLAVAAARRALDYGWEQSTGAERAAVLSRLAGRLRERAEDYARLESRQVGTPFGQLSWLADYCADVVDFYSGAARVRFGRTAELSERRLGLTLDQPVGVVGVITPWNFPLVLTIWKVAAALAAGCTLVVKPAEMTPTTVIELARDLLEVGLPAGVCNVVTGPGTVLGSAMVEHPGIDKIAFTGSTATGQAVMARASGTLKRLSLELGGKSPLIVMPDADPAAAATAAMECFFNAGQQCNVPSRLLLPAGQDDVLDDVVDRARAMRLGSDDEADMGPLVSDVQYRSVRSFLDEARANGVRFLTGDDVPSASGPFVAPTVVDGVAPDARIVRDEVFGPVMTVQRYRDLADAVRLANSGDYGLAAGIFTADLDAAVTASRRLKAGLVWVNTWNSTVPELPTGGMKASGMGRELGLEGLHAYLETKTVLVDPAKGQT
jgi:acyl-CoA reductase-like NAD-dependent aldehyde dehydrogenase